jgi:cyclophilin family peptidyl-prolyl cis-trans isomerase
MVVSRATICALVAIAAACSREVNHSPSGSQSGPDAVAADSSRPARQPTIPVRAETDDEQVIREAIIAGYPDTPLAPADVDRLLGAAAASRSAAVRRAWIFAAARRTPTGLLGRVVGETVPADADTLARALSGRDRSAGPAVFPPVLVPATDEPWTTARATVAQRFQLAVNPPPAATSMLFRPSHAEQLAGARLVGSPTVPVPDASALDLAPAFAIPSLVRSLSSRNEATSAMWAALLTRTSLAVRRAPRIWASAWRAVRDVAATRPELARAVAEAVATASLAEGLPDRTASSFRCENAVAADRAGGRPDATLRCAAPGFEWIALAAQAEVLGSAATLPDRRVADLTELLRQSGGHPQVAEAVAEAAVRLPPLAARPLLRRLAAERDAGVLAAVLDALTLHVQHARTLPPGVRDELVRAPFQLPLGPSLEARVHATQLAAALQLPDPSVGSSRASIRALSLAHQPDAGVAMLPFVPSSAPPVELEVETDAGPFVMVLEPRAGPRAVAAIADAARAARYDGLTFHRVVPGFVVQGGDPRGDGFGGTDEPVPTELNLQPFDRGAIGVPLAGLDTGGIQFFVVLADAPHLDGRYPRIGHVTEGMDVVDGLMIGDAIRHVRIRNPRD